MKKYIVQISVLDWDKTSLYSSKPIKVTGYYKKQNANANNQNITRNTQQFFHMSCMYKYSWMGKLGRFGKNEELILDALHCQIKGIKVTDDLVILLLATSGIQQWLSNISVMMLVFVVGVSYVMHIQPLWVDDHLARYR